MSLCDGYALASNAGGSAQGTPLALAASDFDEDGVQDLVSGFATGSGGVVTIHRGNVAALWPYGAAIQYGPPAAFLPNPRSFTLPESPDFVVTGDFDADGHMDIVTAQRGSSALYFLKGNGHGGFAAAKRVALAGGVTDLIAGEVDRPDGLSDLAVGVTGAGGSGALVYESPLGALNGQPESHALSQPVTALAFGKFTGIPLRDLAIGAGSELTLIHGRDRRLSSGVAQPVAAAVVTKQTLPFSILALVSGDFTGRAPSLAVLGDDGSVHVMEHSVSAAFVSPLGDPNVQPTMQAAGGGRDASATWAGSSAISNTQTRVAALRQLTTQSASSPEWSERSAVALPNGFHEASPRLVAGHITGSQQEDLLVVDKANSQVHVLSTSVSQRQAKVAAAKSGAVSSSVPQMSMLASLNATSSPAAVLPMRLSQHGLSGLVALQSNLSSPVVMPQDVAAAAVFTVTNTLDITDPSQKNTPPAGSLRAAMENAQSSGSCGGNGGTCSIVFNIPTSDPGYNAATGVWLIQPISENVPNSLDNFALPPINATLTIDGYTQPGASPNTLTAADNAKIVIQIDGGKATTPGGSGFSPYFDTGTVIRGVALTGWVNPAVSSSGTASGAMGIELNGVSDFAEGNFIGTVDGKTAASNRIGIFADNGPLSGNVPGNIVGGTTPQARNIISGNSVFGIAFLSTAFEAALQGNFVGLNSSGTAALGNAQDGVGMNGPTVTIGGTLAGARNYIAANGTNVDINDLTNGNAATGSYVQGNYIGTDVTGTVALSTGHGGVSITHNPTNYLIGGTTPAARNIISGNYTGVTITDMSLSNIVQGNYIGTDPTGTIAVPNQYQGIFIGNSSLSTSVPAVSETIGGTIAGAGNVISGNGTDGVSINGSYSTSPGYSPYLGSAVQGNFIGTDATGTNSLPNQGNGVSVQLGGTNNTIGGANGGLGNVIAYNTLNGVLVDSTSTTTPGSGNATVANMIFSNGGAGVRVKSGTGNRVSVNSIYSNAALGIDIDAAGPGTNTHCNATNAGANMLQNYPVLTAGTGPNYITATATDPSGNTSEFSKAVQATQAANILNLLGSFDGVANTNFTIEFFSNSSADASGYGQGKTYLGSTNIKTDANCSGTITDPVDLTGADVSVTQTFSAYELNTGPDFGLYTYNSTVANNGPATAHNVTFTDTLPSQLQVSSTYCNQGVCQSPITTTQGTCSVSGKTITCNLGTVAPGSTANIAIPVQALVTGSIVNAVNVTATETDPNPLNNMASLTENSDNPYAFPDHLDPATALINGQPLPMTIYGTGVLSTTTVTFNGTPVSVTGVVDNQKCGTYGTDFCSGLQITIPASLFATAGTYPVAITNPGSFSSSVNFTAVSVCTYSVNNFIGSNLDSSGTNLIADSVSVYTGGVASCPWTATSSVPWLQILDNATASGSGTVDIAVAPNTTTSARNGSITAAGQTFSFTQSAGSATTCSVTMDPASASPSAAGGTGTINETLSASSCAPFIQVYPQSSSASPNAAWITVTRSPTFASGAINYTVAPNNGPARVGAIVDGGNATIITQAAPSCYFTLSANSTLASSAGATGSVTVTPTPGSCSWTATSSDTTQVTVSSGTPGTGNGTVNYTVAANTGNPRTPTINIGNAAATSVFTINQVSPNACTFTVTPSPTSVTSLGTSNYFLVTASFSFCQWTATSNNPDSLAVTGNATGTGTKAVYYSVAQNTSTAARTLTITAGCQTFTINQSGTSVSNNPVPVLTSLSPSSIAAGSAAFTLTVNGTGFVNGAVVNFNGAARTTTYISATQVTAAILATDVASPGTPPVTVTNPTPGGGTSNSLTFTINAASNPTPVLTSLSPSSIAAGSAAFTLTVNGTGFVNGTTVNFNGTARVTTFISATQVTAAILATDVASPDTPPVTVTNPTPGGGTSNSLTFTINAASNPTPVLTSLQPSSATAGSAAFTLTVNGTGFVSGATVSFNGSTRTTTYVNATQLTAAVLATDVATQGTAPVTVTNPTPGGGTSNALTFTINAVAVNNPVPTITTLQPTSVVAGAAAFTLAVNGTNFISSSTVSFKGTSRTTTFVSATQVTAAILASDVSSAGPALVTVTNPAPGGGTSSPATLTIATPSMVSYTLSSNTPAQVIFPGGAAQYSITVAALNGAYPNPVTLSASGLPPGATAAFSPASVTPGSTSASSTLTIQVPLPIAQSRRSGSSWPLFASVFPLVGLFFAKRSKRWKALMMTLIAVCCVGTLTGCGGGISYFGSNPHVYNIVVTGTNGSTQQSTAIQLTVNF